MRPCSCRGQQHQQDTQSPPAEHRLCLFPCLQLLLPPHPTTHKPSGYPHCQCQGLLTQSDKNGCNITRHCQTNLSLHTHTKQKPMTKLLCLHLFPKPTVQAEQGVQERWGGFSLEEYHFRSALKPKQDFNRKQFSSKSTNKTKSSTGGALDSIPVTKTTVSGTPATPGNSSWRLTKGNVSAAPQALHS